MESALDPLHAVGLLGLFSPEEWIGDASNPGRAACGRLYSKFLQMNAWRQAPHEAGSPGSPTLGPTASPSGFRPGL
jgi:hypothetical protein